MIRVLRVLRALISAPVVEEDPFAFLDGSGETSMAIGERIHGPCPTCRKSMILAFGHKCG